MSAERTTSSALRLVCSNCGKIEYFDSWQQAFEEGWDTLERFGYNACDGCPGVSVYFPMLKAQEARAASGGEREALLAEAAKLTLSFDPKGSDNEQWAIWLLFRSGKSS